MGKKLTKEHKENIGKGHQGKKRAPFSEQWKTNMSNARIGINNPNWRGGISNKCHRIRTSREYRLWREAVYARDAWTCQKCGDDTGGNLNAHHIKNFSEYPELRFAIDNGITFCEKCHIKFHKIYGTNNNTPEQLEEFLKS